ncbi:MAG: prepilin-type N-terminal cleavage/methylation domain-containing protein [Candidatus Sumerlaeota bacterium]|nr:prepilin-type N-terminal cleavage/methylation domain-containing protein [Candidatus Sumerlaeota bacterium]
MALVRCMAGCARSGFTMLELMIVVAIIPILSVGFMMLMLALDQSRERLETRLNINEESECVRALWREDVALASRIEITSGGQAMTIHRSGVADGVLTLRYAIEGGVLRRSDLQAGGAESARGANTNARALARNISDLRFERIGAGCQMSWTANDHDGAQRWQWPQTVFATPVLGKSAKDK